MSCPLQGLLSRAAPNKRCVFRALTLCGARWTTKAVATMQVARVSCKLQVASACGVASWYWMPIYFQQTWPTNCPQRERGRERERPRHRAANLCIAIATPAASAVAPLLVLHIYGSHCNLYGSNGQRQLANGATTALTPFTKFPVMRCGKFNRSLWHIGQKFPSLFLKF